MAIMKKGPGNPAKVASNMSKKSTGKLKNALTTISNKMKAEQAGRDQVKKYKESLKQKKIAEQKAQKDLQLKERGGQRGKMSVSKEVKVTGKQKPTYGKTKGIAMAEGGGKRSTYYANSKSIPTDSAKFMQNLAAVNPKAYKSAMDFMKKQQAATPGARFNFGAMNVRSDEKAARPGETPRRNKGGEGPKKPGQAATPFEYYIPRVTTVLPNKKKK